MHVNPSQDIYAKNPNFVLISSKKVDDDPIVYERIYRDPGCLIAKIGQVALVALLTLVTLGFILACEKGRVFWSNAIDRFKQPVVYVEIPPEKLPSQKPTVITKPTVKAPTTKKPIPKPIVKPISVINPPPTPTVSAADKTLKEKYKDIFAKYVTSSQNKLLIKDTNKDSGFTEKSLLHVIKEVDKIAETKEVKTDGKVIRVDNEQYIVKMDNRKLHIIRSSSAENLKRGRQGIIKKVLIVSSAIFGVLKYVNVNADDPVEDRDFILNEIDMLKFIHEKGIYNGFQDPPVTTLNIHDVKESVSYLGYISNFYEKGDLFSQLDKLSFQERYQLATDLINHAAELWDRGFWHSDYKLENIFVEEVEVSKAKKKPAIRIGDFGFARRLKRDKSKRLHIAPGSHYSQADIDAIIKIEKEKDPKDHEIRELVDKKEVMGVGLSIYQLLAKDFGQNRLLPWQQPFSKSPLISAGCSADVAELILSMAKLNPKERPSMSEIKSLWQAVQV